MQIGYLAINKKGEHGALLFSKGSMFFAPALPLESVFDPTGAGDVFAGAFIASLAAQESSESALLSASASASICIESFGTQKLQNASTEEINERINFLNKTLKSW